MFFRPVGPSTYLLAEYPADVPASSPFYDLLHREAAAAMERNYEILHKRFPNANIVRVPMPPLHFPGDREFMKRSSLATLRGIPGEPALAGVNLDPADWAIQGNASARGQHGNYDDFLIDSALDSQGAGSTGTPDRPRAAQMRHQMSVWKKTDSTPDRQETLVRLFTKLSSLEKRIKDLREHSKLPSPELMADRDRTKEDLKELEKVLVGDQECIYKTYLNSIHIKGRDAEKVLVPSYAKHRNLQSKVEQKYREAYGPQAKIVFIDADELSEQFGALHCITCVLPEFNPVQPKK
jgi:hypothetical protein